MDNVVKITCMQRVNKNLYLDEIKRVYFIESDLLLYVSELYFFQ